MRARARLDLARRVRNGKAAGHFRADGNHFAVPGKLHGLLTGLRRTVEAAWAAQQAGADGHHGRYVEIRFVHTFIVTRQVKWRTLPLILAKCYL